MNVHILALVGKKMNVLVLAITMGEFGLGIFKKNMRVGKWPNASNIEFGGKKTFPWREIAKKTCFSSGKKNLYSDSKVVNRLRI